MSPSPPKPSPRIVLLSGLAVFAVLFAVYTATVAPTAVDQDSGELVSAAHVLGIAHPTGYPLWVLLGRLFDILPLGGTSAYRVAMLSVVTSAAAGAVIAGLGVALTGAVSAGVGAGLAYGLWYPTWSQAVRPEVYGLTGLLFVLTLVALRRWEADRSWRALAWLCLAGGFVSMHHRTAFLAALPAVAAAVVLTRPRRMRLYLGAAGLLAAPFVFYAYLPIRAMARPPVNWTDPSTLDRFLDHALATQYSFFAFDHSPGEMVQGAYTLVPQVLASSPPFSALLGLLGMAFILWGGWRWARREPTSAGALGVGALLLCLWVLQWGETSDLKVFLLPLGAVLALCGALGLAELGSRLGWRGPGRLAVAAVLAVLCGGLVRANWERADLSNMWKHRDRWAALLAQLPPDAVFVSSTDVPSFMTMYLQHVERLHRDITLLRCTRMIDQWYVDLIGDPEVRSAAVEAWRQTAPYVANLPDEAALFSYHLARGLEGRRAVYVLRGPAQTRLEGPPYPISLSEDLVQMQFAKPDLLRPRPPGAVLRELPGGVTLVAFDWDRQQAGAGEMLGFRAQWQLRSSPQPEQFALGLSPEGVELPDFARALGRKGHFVAGFPLLYGLTDLGPSPEGTVYEQQGAMMVPTNAPPGKYRATMGFSPSDRPGDLTLVDLGLIEVAARPRPSNGP